MVRVEDMPSLAQSGRKLYIEMTFALVKGPDASTALGAVAAARAVTGRIDRQRGTDREPH
jgi:hypothetical protein